MRHLSRTSCICSSLDSDRQATISGYTNGEGSLQEYSTDFHQTDTVSGQPLPIISQESPTGPSAHRKTYVRYLRRRFTHYRWARYTNESARSGEANQVPRHVSMGGVKLIKQEPELPSTVESRTGKRRKDAKGQGSRYGMAVQDVEVYSDYKNWSAGTNETDTDAPKSQYSPKYKRGGSDQTSVLSLLRLKEGHLPRLMDKCPDFDGDQFISSKCVGRISPQSYLIYCVRPNWIRGVSESRSHSGECVSSEVCIESVKNEGARQTSRAYCVSKENFVKLAQEGIGRDI